MHLCRSASMDALGVYKHAQVLNALIFRATTKRLSVKIFVGARIILVGAILTEL